MWNVPGPWLTQCPAVHTTLRFWLVNAVPEHTKFCAPEVKKTLPWVDAGNCV